MHIEAVADTTGQICRAVLADLTGRKLIEKKLQKTQSNLVAAQKLAQIGSWEWNVRDDTAIWSDETYRLFGMDKSDLGEHHKNFLDLIAPEDRENVDRALRDALDGVRNYDIEYRICLADGEERIIHALAEVSRD